MSEVSEFAVKVLKQYAEENSVIVRSTSDLSPLEEYLICQLFKSEGIWKRALRQVSIWRMAVIGQIKIKDPTDSFKIIEHKTNGEMVTHNAKDYFSKNNIK